MDKELEREMRLLLDKRAIEECLLRYTRGIDRMDEAMIRSAFHDDAIDNHSRFVRGQIGGMLDWWLPLQSEREATQHFAMNQTIDLDGDVAHSEAYFLCLIKMNGSDRATLSGGRYADRFERREGQWKIALRVVLSEWKLECDAASREELAIRAIDIGARDRTDPTYQRPLQDPVL